MVENPVLVRGFVPPVMGNPGEGSLEAPHLVPLQEIFAGQDSPRGSHRVQDSRRVAVGGPVPYSWGVPDMLPSPGMPQDVHQEGPLNQVGPLVPLDPLHSHQEIFVDSCPAGGCLMLVSDLHLVPVEEALLNMLPLEEEGHPDNL